MSAITTTATSQMTVSALAKAAGVSADTVRFYTREGLLHPTRDPNNRYQRYGTNDLQRLRFARKARQLGFSLREVTAILGDADQHRSPCPHVRDLFAHKLAAVEQQLLELTALRDRMRDATAHWQTMPDGAPDGETICALIEHWDEPVAHGDSIANSNTAAKAQRGCH
ncbi:MAG: transcriptional regulator, MerR family [Verrucomicrobiaceae bacterium]|nr:transcriptional regulator, MerR family [Verrucomicrobiaceae bacterium]